MTMSTHAVLLSATIAPIASAVRSDIPKNNAAIAPSNIVTTTWATPRSANAMTSDTLKDSPPPSLPHAGAFF